MWAQFLTQRRESYSKVGPFCCSKESAILKVVPFIKEGIVVKKAQFLKRKSGTKMEFLEEVRGSI